MKNKEKRQFTATIGDVPVRFEIEPDEELIYRRACYSLNKLWERFCMEPNSNSHMALAKTALFFAELNYRKSAQLEEHDSLLKKFEEDLDDILLDVK